MLFVSARVYNNKNEAIDLYGSAVEVDYRGYEVSSAMIDEMYFVKRCGLVDFLDDIAVNQGYICECEYI